MQIGNYECFAIVMDSFLLDGGAMFGVVPKTLWEKKIPADDANLIPMTARSLIIRGNGKTILVDTGIGDKLSKKFKEIYGIHETANSMDERLAPYNLTPADITDVIITHLHFDHAGGSTTIINGDVVPTFPNATYHVQRSQWELAFAPSIRDQSSYIQENFLPLLNHDVLHFIEGNSDDFIKGLDLIVTDGHTRGQQHPLVKGETQSLFFCADLIPTSAHIPTAWIMGYDNHPLTIMEEKDKIIARAVEENWILCFEHDPVVAAASIRKVKGKVAIDQVIAL